jgi:hypothetical protein
MSNGETPTKGVDWRKPREEGFVLALPSGNSARIRPVALDVLLRNGEIPDLLTPFVAQMVYSGVDTDELDKLLSPEVLTEQSTEMLGLIDAVVTAAFVEPRIVAEPQADDEISIADVELADRGTVFSLAVLPANDLRRFLERQAASVESIQDGDGDGTETEQPGPDS